MAKNINQLQAEIMAKILKAMNEVAGEALKAMNDGIDYFYSGGVPLVYERTEAMRDTPTISKIKESGDAISFEAYLNTQHNYTTGKNPNMLQVLLLTNDLETNQPNIGYLRKAVGSPHYWDRVLAIMERAYYNVLDKYFTRI